MGIHTLSQTHGLKAPPRCQCGVPEKRGQAKPRDLLLALIEGDGLGVLADSNQRKPEIALPAGQPRKQSGDAIASETVTTAKGHESRSSFLGRTA